MIKVKDGYAKLIGTTYSGSVSRVLLSNGGDHILGNSNSNIPLNNGTVNTNLNADMLDGLHIHEGRNNEVNKIVRTDISGYILAGWINTTSGDIGAGAINKIYCSNDNYIRYKTPANFFPTLANSGNDISITVAGLNRKLTVGYATNTDKLDGYHAHDFVKIKLFRFSQYNQGTWTKILTITINSTTDLLPVIAFSWIPSECSRTIWADFSINWRSNSPIFYAIWKGMDSRTLKVVNSSGAIWDVWVSGSKTSWDPFGEIQVTYTHNIISYNGGSLGYSDTDPGGTICITGGLVNYANSAGSVAWSNVTGKPSSFTPSAHTHSWTSITDKLVAGNEFNIVNAGFNAGMWFNYLPINDRSKTATITGYHFGNGATGYTSIKASGFVKNGSSSNYVLLGDGGHKAESSLRVEYASSAGNADTLDGTHLNGIFTAFGNNGHNITATIGGVTKSFLVNWAADSDKLDGIHASGLLTALSNSNNGISITVGGTTKSISNISVNYANSAGSASSATKVIVNLNTTNDTNYPLVWSNLSNTNTITENQLYKSWSDLYYNPKNKRLTVGGSVVASSFVKRGGTSLQLLRADGGIATFNWSGQSGLPTWLWGGNNEHSYYVYNPSNFRVAYATSAGSADTALYLRSLGNLNCQTGRTLNYGDVYTYNTYDGNTGSPTTFTSVIGFGRGIAGTVEIAGGWDNTNLYWRSLRDCCEDWHSWRTVLDSNNYTEFINNYYWANVKISTSSSTTTSPTVYTLTATRVCAGHNPEIDNSISCSNWFRSSGDTGWYNTTYRGGWYMSDTSWIRAKNGVGIYTSGLMKASGFHHGSMDSNNYMLLAGGGYKSFGGDYNNPIFLGYLDLSRGNDGTISSSFYCLGYSVPFTYTRGGNYCKISIPNTTHQTFYIKAATASVNYSGGGMDTWTGNHRGAGAWWLHCYTYSSNEVRVKGFCLKDTNNDSWWGGNPLWFENNGANRITVCIFGYVTFR